MPKMSYSLNREDQLRNMVESLLDVLVIGGGITGAGIAWDASLRGMRVGLLEMNDFASGTSSRSTKLIHGGLRYLKQGDINLVREVGRERALLHKKLPHLVIPMPMLLPIYKGGTYGYFASSIGLYMYDLLAGVKRSERRKMLNREEALLLEPLFKTDNLKGAGYYYEYRTDDARLTIEVIKSAMFAGASVANYVKVTDFIYRNGICVGVKVQDQLTQNSFEIFAKKVVNAAGPWVDTVRKQDGSLKGKRLFLTKGVHLVFSHNKIPVKQAAYFDTPDGRMIFVIPRGDVTYVGTTDTPYSGAIEQPKAACEDRDYLLAAIHNMFPSLQVKPEDIISNWAGIRPLIYEEGKGPSELSRKDELILSESGLITIAGGKLTGFRKMAEKVVDLLAKHFHDEDGKVYADCTTDEADICGGANGDHQSTEKLKLELVQQGRTLGLQDHEVQELYSLYGANAFDIYSLFDQEGGTNKEYNLLRAQVLYSLNFEMTVKTVDFLARRTGLFFFNPVRAGQLTQAVVAIMGDVLGWSEERRYMEIKEAELEIQAIKNLSKTKDHLKEEVQ